MTDKPSDDITDEERELVKGMPPHVAAGFIASRREDWSKNRWRKLGEELQNVMDSAFTKPGE